MRVDILRWIAHRWDHIAGNDNAKQFFRRVLRRVRQQIDAGEVPDATRLCMLLVGPSRSGKTSLVKFFIRCLLCECLDPTTLNPCEGTCPSCRERPELYGSSGLFATLHAVNSRRSERTPVHFVPVDCARVYTPTELRSILDDLADGIANRGLRVVYLDEVHRLVHRSMDEILLKAVEERPFLWILSTAKPESLEDMLKNRMLKIHTQLPSDIELEDFLVTRCEEWGIAWEPDAIIRVVEKSNRIVGIALHALALASLAPEEGLTLDVVESDWIAQPNE